MSNNQLDFIWQDREIFFDCKPSQLNDRPGEKVIDSINSVEDTKGNNGERGALIITNLRIKWISHTNTKINLSKSSLFLILYVLHNNNTSTYLFLNQVLA
jgi:Bardet-Biedl syndrome 5 protein